MWSCYCKMYSFVHTHTHNSFNLRLFLMNILKASLPLENGALCREKKQNGSSFVLCSHVTLLNLALCYLSFHLQAGRACVLPQTLGVLDHLRAEAILSKEGQGPARAPALAQSWCSRPWPKDSLCHRNVSFLSSREVWASWPKVSWQEHCIGEALVDDPCQRLFYLHDSRGVTLATRTFVDEKHATVRWDCGSRRRKKEKASHGGGKKKNQRN